MSLTESIEEVSGRGWWRETTPTQIKNLLEKGKSAEQIAEVLGTTAGSLRALCSKHQISLRRPAEFREPRPPRTQIPAIQIPAIQSNNGLQKILTLETELRAKVDEHIKAAEIIKAQLVGIAMARKALE